MSRVKYLLTLWIVMASVSAFAGPAKVGDFALLDSTGRFHQLSYYGDQQAVVITAQAASALARVDTLKALQSIDDQLDAAEVEFFVLTIGADSLRDDMNAKLNAADATFPILMDPTGIVADDLGLNQGGDSIAINAQTLAQQSHGDLAAVTASLSAGVPLTAAAKLDNAVMATPARPTDVSYVNDIVPMLEKNCVGCHHEGGIGPWPMNSHAMVKGWSPMMREVVMTKRMPPGQIDTHVSSGIKDVAGLTSAEQAKLIAWIDAGAPKDGDLDPLVGQNYAGGQFTLGEPDIVLTVPAQEIPANGVLDYRYVPVQLNLDRDIWIQAMEFVPGDKQVLHHIITYLSSPADKTGDRDDAADRGENIAGFAPGRQPDAFADNSGRLIPKGSNLLLQMHYTTSGRATVDETTIGIFLHDKPPKHVMSGGVAGQRRFMIPPGVKEHKLSGEMLVERDAMLYQMTPHMHYRGRYMSYTAEYPDGTSKLLLSVPKYDFNWQFSYRLEEPEFLPAGTKLIASGAMDNSEQNLGNPDPTKPVFFGLQTMHEMFFGFVTLRYTDDIVETAASDADAGQSDTAGGG